MAGYRVQAVPGPWNVNRRRPATINEDGRCPGSTPKLRTLAVLLLVIVLAGCSPTPRTGTDSTAAVTLTATLVSPTDITLRWKGGEPDAAADSVEYATAPGGPYTILQFLPLSETTYDHRDLMPETAFYYRIRPVFGPASTAVRVELPPGAFDDAAQTGDGEWAKPRVDRRGPVVAQPIRNAASAAAAAPTDLNATVMDPDSIKFTWTDHASDEEGYMLEVKADGSPGFAVAAVLDPDINSVGLVTLSSEKRASYRVRAFYYGKPSNVAHQTAGDG
jgi:hypothetical protein